MKSTIVLCCFLMASSYLFGQDLIKRDEIDEFTKTRVIETEWTSFNGDLTSKVCYVRFRKIDSMFVLDFKMILREYLDVDEGEKLMFKLTNGEIVKLFNPKYTRSCEGCGAIGYYLSGAIGIELNIPIERAVVESLKSSNIEKFRLYTTDGYVDQEVKPKHSLEVMKLIRAVDKQ